jgi:hypothetical protein
MSHYEAGDYRAKIVRQGFSESKNKSTPFFFIEIEPFESLGANTLPEKIYKRSIDWYCTEKTMSFTIEKLRSLGWEGTKLAELEPGHPSHHSFVGNDVQVYCKIEDGFDRFDLAREGAGGGGGPELKVGIASQLDKLFGKSLIASVPKTKAPPRPKPPAAEGVAEDDEIPF